MRWLLLVRSRKAIVAPLLWSIGYDSHPNNALAPSDPSYCCLHTPPSLPPSLPPGSALTIRVVDPHQRRNHYDGHQHRTNAVAEATTVDPTDLAHGLDSLPRCWRVCSGRALAPLASVCGCVVVVCMCMSNRHVVNRIGGLMCTHAGETEGLSQWSSSFSSATPTQTDGVRWACSTSSLVWLADTRRIQVALGYPRPLTNQQGKVVYQHDAERTGDVRVCFPITGKQSVARQRQRRTGSKQEEVTLRETLTWLTQRACHNSPRCGLNV